MSLPLVREHTDAVIDMLEGLSLTVGDGEAPKDADPPYLTVYAISGGSRRGPLARPSDDADLIYQVSCTGVSRQQAEWLADRAQALLGGLDVPGRRILHISLESHGGVQRDDDIDPPVFTSTPRFRIISTPGVEEES